MNTTKHTPGPWHICTDDDGNPLSGRPGVFSSDELDCGIVHWDGFKQTYWQSARGEKEMHANAQLIAAAPDLLEALDHALRVLDNVHLDILLSNGMPAIGLLTALKNGRTAIAKATGEQK